MEWGTPVFWGRFLLFCVPQSVKTKETNTTRPESPTPCKQARKSEKKKNNNTCSKQFPFSNMKPIPSVCLFTPNCY